MLFNIAALAVGLLSVANDVVAVGPAPVNLATAGNFAILAKAGVSNVPPSAITGNIGVSPIAANGLVGFSLVLDSSGTFSTSSQVTGKITAASYAAPTPATLTTAISDLSTAFTDATGRASPNFTNLANGAIGGLTLAPGLYKWSTAVNATSGFTIAGASTDTWIFQLASTFNLPSGVRVTLTGGALASNIVWVVSGAVTLGTTSHLEGVVIGKTSATLQTGASVNGRILVETNVVLQAATVVG